jgi:hypothetical protein
VINLSVHAYQHLTGEFEVLLTIQDCSDPGERPTQLYAFRGMAQPQLVADKDDASMALLAVFDACRAAYDEAPF